MPPHLPAELLGPVGRLGLGLADELGHLVAGRVQPGVGQPSGRGQHGDDKHGQENLRHAAAVGVPSPAVGLRPRPPGRPGAGSCPPAVAPCGWRRVGPRPRPGRSPRPPRRARPPGSRARSSSRPTSRRRRQPRRRMRLRVRSPSSLRGHSVGSLSNPLPSPTMAPASGSGSGRARSSAAAMQPEGELAGVGSVVGLGPAGPGQHRSQRAQLGAGPRPGLSTRAISVAIVVSAANGTRPVTASMSTRPASRCRTGRRPSRPAPARARRSGRCRRPRRPARSRPPRPGPGPARSRRCAAGPRRRRGGWPA